VNALRAEVVEMSRLYGTLTMPIEIVHGDADTIVPAAVHSIPLSALAPGANLTLLPGVGHMPHHAAPEAVLAAIDRARVRARL
jgi:pimeloyl-ACP methyl ester carboxylesterase